VAVLHWRGREHALPASQNYTGIRQDAQDNEEVSVYPAHPVYPCLSLVSANDSVIKSHPMEDTMTEDDCFHSLSRMRW